MANFKLGSQFNFGKYKGQYVIDVIEKYKDIKYIDWLHHSHFNIKFTKEVFDYINSIQQ